MQKWEYCIITGLSEVPAKGFKTVFPKMLVFTAKGAELKNNFQYDRPRGISEEDFVARAIAALGTDGWELVSAGATGSLHSLYFKRPI